MGSTISKEDEELSKKLLEEFKRKRADEADLPPVVASQPDKWAYEPGDGPIGEFPTRHADRESDKEGHSEKNENRPPAKKP